MNLIFAAADAAGKLHDIQSTFGIEGKYLLMQVISFSILAFVLYRFFFKPVLATVDERNAEIATSLANAEAMKAKLEAATAESADIIKQAQGEAGKIIDQARVSAKEFMERQTQEATVKAQDIIAKAQHSTELEHRKMVAEARSEIARLVVSTTRQVLAKELSDADRQRFNEAAAKELTLA
ncbi:F0F1 ATP synthase subunit B [Synoicihabitans lomoniglobus]|uniref:ATP synthase subunit b n=1 Tax=Synoicihabitans lomoniglobus TaxID=2909285 RepID=A0AAE9ZUV3_9BACT|nr:F0F1 ATP synthase subunit B [Opitutaceae bacterium LMO-M01]WED64527.1 F0F1 ATP synthase subunit B [Opitutaceae bacterium LMO-M01]